MEGMIENNSKISEQQKKWEISNPEVVKAFAEYAYHMETSESGVPTEMLREGYLGIERRIHELKNSVPSRESLAEIEDLQYFSDKVKAIENKARFSMTMWQMANEVNLAASGTQLSPEDFLLNLTSAGVDISTGTRYSHRDGNYFKAVMESYSSYNPGLRQDAGTQYYGSEVYDLSMRISEFAGHNDPAELSREDIPRIFAYQGALVEKIMGR
jgi:hypothetical protein